MDILYCKTKRCFIFLKKINKYLIVKREWAFEVIPILEEFVENQDRKESIRTDTIKYAKELRKLGYSYRKIGKKLDIDFGHARRLILK